jgi:hypothetical protein
LLEAFALLASLKVVVQWVAKDFKRWFEAELAKPV